MDYTGKSLMVIQIIKIQSDHKVSSHVQLIHCNFNNI